MAIFGSPMVKIPVLTLLAKVTPAKVAMTMTALEVGSKVCMMRASTGVDAVIISTLSPRLLGRALAGVEGLKPRSGIVLSTRSCRGHGRRSMEVLKIGG